MGRFDQLHLACLAPVPARSRPGRRPGPNPRVRHRARETFARGLPCHVTLKVRQDVPSLRTVKLVRELERTFRAGCERGEFRLVHYSLQDNHAHLIVEAKDRRALGRGMKSLGARLARAVNRIFRRRGPVLADRYHVRVLEGPTQVRNAIAYVLLNARRHAKRVSLAWRVDPASSGRWFEGWSRPVERERAPPPVAPPHFWLTSVGWRRGGGRLDPVKVPGRE